MDINQTTIFFVLTEHTQVYTLIKYLVHAGSGLVEKSPGLNVFWYQLASHNWDLRPPVKDFQRQILIGLYWLVYDTHTHTHRKTDRKKEYINPSLNQKLE